MCQHDRTIFLEAHWIQLNSAELDCTATDLFSLAILAHSNIDTLIYRQCRCFSPFAGRRVGEASNSGPGGASADEADESTGSHARRGAFLALESLVYVAAGT